MTRISTYALFLTALLTTPILANDPIVGLWQTEPDDGRYAHIDITLCEDKICGTISEVFDTEGNAVESERIGKQIVWDMQAAGDGKYRKGKIWRASNDKIYNSKMTLDGDQLVVKGCIGPICLGQDWQRVE